ncbi:MAG TPA: pyruvate formate-lyase-activating protein [Acetobacteraceae bacterium]|jgi:pyruvate formate lyase activating enzyme|nr:pyruvate formate-lyase-activating protein [Acetobacteraceae bacterium]
MSSTDTIEAGSRYDLRSGKSPNAPDEVDFNGSETQFGWVHSYETGSTVDGPGIRTTVFMSGCLLRCQYCHNPDTWHLKDGTRIDLAQAVQRLKEFAGPLRHMGGGLTISGGEPLVQLGFTRGLFRAAKEMRLHTALDTSGFLGDRCDDSYLDLVDLVLLDIKSGDPATYLRVTGKDLEPTLRFAERLAAINKPVWVRFVLVPGLTDEPANVRAVGRIVAAMGNVEWLELLPFHQLGAFKWKALRLEYPLAITPPASVEQVAASLKILRDAGCRVR